MLLDSGAGVSLVPRQGVLALGVAVDAAAVHEWMGFDGNRSVALAVNLDLAFQARKIRGRFLWTDHECVILGRDILNHVSLSLDGPSLIWDERIK